jgi:hypothetical protein
MKQFVISGNYMNQLCNFYFFLNFYNKDKLHNNNNITPLIHVVSLNYKSLSIWY